MNYGEHFKVCRTCGLVINRMSGIALEDVLNGVSVTIVCTSAYLFSPSLYPPCRGVEMSVIMEDISTDDLQDIDRKMIARFQ